MHIIIKIGLLIPNPRFLPLEWSDMCQHPTNLHSSGFREFYFTQINVFEMSERLNNYLRFPAGGRRQKFKSLPQVHSDLTAGLETKLKYSDHLVFLKLLKIHTQKLLKVTCTDLCTSHTHQSQD